MVDSDGVESGDGTLQEVRAGVCQESRTQDPGFFCEGRVRITKEMLLEVEREAMNTPACASLKLTLSVVILIPMGFCRTLFDPYLVVLCLPFPLLSLYRVLRVCRNESRRTFVNYRF